ncbi:MAG: hypothetical protein HKL87_01260 [Acidimicrobiaceae bacterium]|nr:hypothetical protein [Acidimicrobiaceae bacterium]
MVRCLLAPPLRAPLVGLPVARRVARGRPVLRTDERGVPDRVLVEVSRAESAGRDLVREVRRVAGVPASGTILVPDHARPGPLRGDVVPRPTGVSATDHP